MIFSALVRIQKQIDFYGITWHRCRKLLLLLNSNIFSEIAIASTYFFIGLIAGLMYSCSKVGIVSEYIITYRWIVLSFWVPCYGIVTVSRSPRIHGTHVEGICLDVGWISSCAANEEKYQIDTYSQYCRQNDWEEKFRFVLLLTYVRVNCIKLKKRKTYL